MLLLDDNSNMRLIISVDVISSLDSCVIKNIKVEIAESIISSSSRESNDDINLTPPLRRIYILLIASLKKKRKENIVKYKITFL